MVRRQTPSDLHLTHPVNCGASRNLLEFEVEEVDGRVGDQLLLGLCDDLDSETVGDRDEERIDRSVDEADRSQAVRADPRRGCDVLKEDSNTFTYVSAIRSIYLELKASTIYLGCGLPSDPDRIWLHYTGDGGRCLIPHGLSMRRYVAFPDSL